MTQHRCSCRGSNGMVQLCASSDWVPTGCSCDGHTDDPDDGGVEDAGSDANAPEVYVNDADGGTDTSTLSVSAEPSDDATYLFDQKQLRTYDILIAQADLDTINAHPAAEAWVPARLKFEGTIYGPFKVRYKGAAGSFRWPCTTKEFDDPKAGKCSMKLGFNEVDPEGRFFGLKKLNLHALNFDPSLMRDRLSYALFREHGVAAPRAVHARVLINGKLEGLFAAVEQIDGRFTRARFGDGGEGNLYKEAWPIYDDPNEYLYALETNKDEQPSVERMLEWKRAIASDGDGLQAFVNTEYFARYMAVDRVIVNDDGILHFYCESAKPGSWNHNFFFYESERRFWPIPWDMDFTFDGSPWVRIRPDWSQPAAACMCTDSEYGAQIPPSCDPVVQQLMRMESEYEHQVDLFIAGPFAAERVDAKLERWTQQIRAAVIEAADIYDGPTEATFAEGLDVLKQKITATRKARGLRF